MINSLGDVMDLISAPDITDIEYNSTSDYVFTDGTMGRKKRTLDFSSAKAQSFLNAVSSFHDYVFNSDHPVLSVKLPDELSNCRLQAYMPPVTNDTSIILRKPGSIFPITDYTNINQHAPAVGGGMPKSIHSSSDIVDLLSWFISNRKNILICGSTGAGKTSFLNALLSLMGDLCPNDRINVLEDTHEVQCDMINCEYLFKVDDRQGESVITMSDCVNFSLRNNPDRLIVGEVRAEEAAYAVLKAWDTGHEGGLCTFHAGGALKGYSRFYRMAGLDWKNPLDQQFAAGAMDLILFLSKIEGTRAIREIVSVSYDYADDSPTFNTIYNSNS